MLYREAGQFKTSYAADQQLFPIRQDRIGLIVLLAIAFLGVPLLASEYWFSAILIPFLIFALAALGLNILTGYAGQLSLGSAAFMASAFTASTFFSTAALAAAAGLIAGAAMGAAAGAWAKEADAKPAAMARAMILFSICILLERAGFVRFGRHDCRPLHRTTQPRGGGLAREM